MQSIYISKLKSVEKEWWQSRWKRRSGHMKAAEKKKKKKLRKETTRKSIRISIRLFLAMSDWSQAKALHHLYINTCSLFWSNSEDGYLSPALNIKADTSLSYFDSLFLWWQPRKVNKTCARFSRFIFRPQVNTCALPTTRFKSVSSSFPISSQTQYQCLQVM